MTTPVALCDVRKQDGRVNYLLRTFGVSLRHNKDFVQTTGYRSISVV